MKISVLVENHDGDMCSGEHGLSLFVEVGDVKVLFDTGSSPLFIKNAVKMGLDIHSANYVVLSHGHYDHGNGLEYLINKELVCHTGCFINRYRKSDQKPIGLPLTLQQARDRFTLVMSEEPIELGEGLFFMGEIPRRINHERFIDNEGFSYLTGGVGDPILDDSALVYETPLGNIIITGCSHSGICNMVERAMTITGDMRTYMIIGGLHLRELNEKVYKTVAYLKEHDIKYIYPIHCTDESVVSYMENTLTDTSIKRIKSGDILDL